jgi:GNAT superfamily N-acetyltransferase
MIQPSADSPSVSIRHGTPADAAALAEFAARTFQESFGVMNDPVEVAAYLRHAYGPPQQEAELRDPDHVTLLAEWDGELAGYAQLRRFPTPPCVTGPHAVELRRFYVDAPFHGRGLAQRLMAEAVSTARRMGFATLWLAVWEHNPRGMAFYQKSGFSDVGWQPFLLGAEVQTDRVMARALQE